MHVLMKQSELNITPLLSPPLLSSQLLIGTDAVSISKVELKESNISLYLPRSFLIII